MPSRTWMPMPPKKVKATKSPEMPPRHVQSRKREDQTNCDDLHQSDQRGQSHGAGHSKGSLKICLGQTEHGNRCTPASPKSVIQHTAHSFDIKPPANGRRNGYVGLEPTPIRLEETEKVVLPRLHEDGAISRCCYALGTVEAHVKPLAPLTVRWRTQMHDETYRLFDFCVVHKSTDPPDFYQASLYFCAKRGQTEGKLCFIMPEEPGEYVLTAVRDLQQVHESIASARSDPGFLVDVMRQSDTLLVLGSTTVNVQH